VIGALGLVYLGLRMTILHEDMLGHLRSSFCVIFSIWAATLLQVFARHTSRTKQYWSVAEKEAFEQPNPDWDPKSSGEGGKLCVNVSTCLFLILYIGGITALLAWQNDLPADSSLASYSSIFLTVVIKGGNFLWTQLAPLLVKFENHRTESAEEDKLAGLLAGVKLFVANFPFFSHCFLSNSAQAKCASTFEEAAAKTWKSYDASLVDAETLEVLKAYSFERQSWSGVARVCIRGCHPPDYATAELYTKSNCDVDVEANLTTYFAFAVAIEIALLILPILLSYWEITKEYKKLQAKGDCSESEDGDETAATYSFLQWEAKKFPYSFNSYGGDKINDFLDMAINYSVVACWGVLYPPMATVAAVAFFILLRLRVYRMLYVTRRPLPRASAGLGIWKDIFQCINVVAVMCNVGLAALFFYPMRMKSMGYQLLLFVLLEHAMLLLQATVKFLISEEPNDVVEIKYYNEFVKSNLNKKAKARMPAPPKTKVDHVSVSLNPENIPTDDDSDS